MIKTSAYAKAKNSKKIYQIKKVWITLTEKLANTYMDEDGNIQFLDQFLEEIVENKQQSMAANSEEANTLNKILEKLIENTQTSGHQNLKKISKTFVIKKFTNKNPNANQWIDIFEKECIRFNVTDDEKKS